MTFDQFSMCMYEFQMKLTHATMSIKHINNILKHYPINNHLFWLADLKTGTCTNAQREWKLKKKYFVISFLLTILVILFYTLFYSIIISDILSWCYFMGDDQIIAYTDVLLVFASHFTSSFFFRCSNGILSGQQQQH